MDVLFADEDVAVATLVKVLASRFPKDHYLLTPTLAKAREQLWSQKFELLVLDIWMPPDDQAVPQSSDQSGLIAGLQLLSMIRTDDKCPNHATPFIIFTALNPAEHPRIQRFFKEQPHLFFPKPMLPDAFHEIMQKAIEDQRK